MSYKITIKGIAKSKYKNIEKLDGISCQDNFADYFQKSFSFYENISNGYMHFNFTDERLWTITEYFSDRELNYEELNILLDYTKGQWSDGIGEGFEQFSCMQDENGKDVFISPSSTNQIVTIAQEVSYVIVKSRIEKDIERDKSLEELNSKINKLVKEGEDLIKRLSKS